MAERLFYYKVEIFALGELGGGCWEDDVVVDGPTPEAAYNAALDYLREQGFAYESKIVNCNETGEEFE